MSRDDARRTPPPARGRGRGVDPSLETRRARTRDLDDRVYERARRRQAEERRRRERASYDPGPPSDDDWVVPDDGDGLRRVGPPTPLGPDLQRFVERQGWAERLRGVDAWERWEKIVGPDLAGHCEPARLVHRTLTLRAESQVWATQLRYLASGLQANLDEALGAGTVREITVVVGPLEGRRAPELGGD
ncbi:MAG: DUF721 domain-containing protein [Nitriliruptoraceae bacterium]|nr:DUF721 domain-containing protein [Nitriliruptoraceae bacterium]